MNIIRKIILILTIIILSSCKTTKIIEVPVETVKTEYLNKLIHDSVFVSVSTETSTINDTVFLTKILYKYKYKYLKDTVCIRDTIPKIIKVKEVEYVNKLTLSLRIFYWIGIVTSIILISTIFYKIKQFKL